MAINAEQPSDDWVWVRYLAGTHPYSTVRTSAWSALVSADPDAAIAAFLAPGGGFDYAVERAQQRRARNMDFVRRVYETTTPDYSPQVHNEAKRLLGPNATDAERETFVRSGYEAARSRDRVYRDQVGKQRQALVQHDRDYVRSLSTNDPGEQVRLSASYAMREGATDDDLVEFFAYGWAAGSRLDLEVFRMRHATDNMQWRSTIVRLIADAEAAEKAAREASEEAKQQAKDAATRAWQQVGTQTQPARSGWSEAQQSAVRQAENWRAVLAAAQAALGPNWTSIIDPAKASEAAWSAERDSAAQQAAYWNALLQQAIDGEQRVKHTL
ncbi:hypothetical protein [Actinosynnema sp. ALI-1.44]|uniref:hypothetical protein n=1 Tax=Actinosynnema sp. ALI-1.44 TaxID=1933779 RepID=UPI0009FF403D|nr:hypothetical protein [Actinosynnema sp. ALI-1.44]